MVVTGLLGLKAGYDGFKFIYYAQKFHPIIARRDIRFNFLSGFNFKFITSLYRHFDVDDPKFHHLQRKAKNGYTCLGISVIVLLLVFMFYVLYILFK